MSSELRLLPQLALTDLLEKALGRWCFRSAGSRAILRSISGRMIAVQVEPPGLTAYLIPNPEGFQIQTEHSGDPDVTLSGSLMSFASLGLGRSPREALTSREIRISGDAETATLLQKLFADESGMWQDRLATLVGPIVADQLAGIAGTAKTWTENTATAVRKDIAEFLQEEARAVPAPAEGEAFLAGVDRLRHDYDRLEARLTRLRTRSGNRPNPRD